ncbi:MAG: hypothetical protein QOH65_2230 [Methylobacteriaceae bacterium]|jgi:uncharacterized protein (DUF2336 family)|nr:hypothetical protein [Methylobacteriaceae bacterium]
MKPILLRVITDQFVSKAKHPVADIRQYEELATQLLPQADVPTAVVVAKHLGPHPEAPPSIIEKLLDKDPDVAAALFATPARIEGAKLAERAEWGSMAEAVAIAGRKTLDARTAAGLARRQETEVLCALAANRDAPLDAHATAFLLQRGRMDRELGLVLLARTDLNIDKSALFLLANSQQRADMLAARNPDHGMRGGGKRMAQRDLDALADLAAAQKWGLFAIELAMRLGCDPRGVQAIIRDKSGESLAVALAALGMQPADAARIFLSSEPDISHSVDRIRTLTRIVSDLSVNAARHLMAAMLGQSLASDTPRHRRYEQAPELASLAGREHALRRTSAQPTRPLAPAGRVGQQRS